MTTQAAQPAPLIIQEQGSFAVGGTVITHPGSFDPRNPTDLAGQSFHGDHAQVSYQTPVGARPLPLLLWHGWWEDGRCWATTPDGREGFTSIFLRRRFSVYVLDQPRRDSAGRTTVAAPITTTPNEQWFFNQFRLADVLVHGVSAALDRIGPAILLTHSHAGGFGWLTQIETPNVRAVVSLEPGSGFVFLKGKFFQPCLARTARSRASLCHSRTSRRSRACRSLCTMATTSRPSRRTSPAVTIGASARTWPACGVDTINKHGGDAIFVSLPERGIHGNTHFAFSDLNNLEVADHISAFLTEKRLD